MKSSPKNPIINGFLKNQEFIQIKKYLLFYSLAYQGKDIAFRFIIEYSSLRDFDP